MAWALAQWLVTIAEGDLLIKNQPAIDCWTRAGRRSIPRSAGRYLDWTWDTRVRWKVSGMLLKRSPRSVAR